MNLEEKIKQSFFNLFERPRTPKTIHVSALPFCLRKEFFNIRFNAIPLPNSSMILGKILHTVIKDLDFFKGTSVRFEEEVREELKNEYVLSGRIDAISDISVFEFKFTKRLDSEELDALYFAQANAYAVMSACSKFYLIKVHTETFDVRVLEGEADKQAFEALKQRALTIIDCLESNKLPHGPERDWECKNCIYNIVCKNLKEDQGRLE